MQPKFVSYRLHKSQKSRKERLIELAKTSGKKQLLNLWIEPCCDEDCECDNNVFQEFAMPDGSIKIVQTCLEEIE